MGCLYVSAGMRYITSRRGDACGLCLQVFHVREVHLWAVQRTVRLLEAKVWHWPHAGMRSRREQSAMLAGVSHAGGTGETRLHTAALALTSTERKGWRGDRVFFMCACREADPAAARAAAEEEAAVAGQHHRPAPHRPQVGPACIAPGAPSCSQPMQQQALRHRRWACLTWLIRMHRLGTNADRAQ